MFTCFVGMVSVLALILWVLVVSSEPSTHNRISIVEKNYIANSLRQQLQDEEENKKVNIFYNAGWGVHYAYRNI